MIELAVGIAILAILVVIAVPSFRTWLQNSQIRNAAESIQNGLQRARAAAVARNANVEFVLGAGSSWVVKLVGVPVTPMTPAIDSRPSSEGSKDVTVVAVAADLATAATTITFNNLGGVVPAANSLAQVDLAAPGGTRNLRIVIGVGGSVRMCDPNLDPGSGLRAC